MTLLLAWKFDEASGAVTDVSGNGRGFSLTGNTVRTAAGSGYTYSGVEPNSKGLTQSAASLQAGPALTGLQTTSRTMMCWAKAPGADPSWFLEFHRNTEDTGVWGFLYLSGVFRFRAKNSSNTPFDITITADAANWHHLAVTHDGTTLKVYRDGTLIGSGTSMAFPVWTADDFRVLDMSGSGLILDEVRYYDQVLDATTIGTLMNTPVAGNATVNGVLAADLGSSATVLGVRETNGTAALNSGFTGTLLGVPQVIGTGTGASVGFTAAIANGLRTVPGTAQMGSGFVATATTGVLMAIDGHTLTYHMNRKAGTIVNGVPTKSAQGAANIWAGTTDLDLVHALNVKAGNTLPNYRELAGVLNQLAGTTGLEVDGAASNIP